MNEIYVIGCFVAGTFDHYVRKGRNNSISAYDNLASAKRGLTQTRAMCGRPDRYRIINFKDGRTVEV